MVELSHFGSSEGCMKPSQFFKALGIAFPTRILDASSRWNFALSQPYRHM